MQGVEQSKFIPICGECPDGWFANTSGRLKEASNPGEK
jgi:hypothetical protein